ncbi:MAG: hypothetical protein ACM33U_07590 [Solirubrobacterales bacterium]|nr:hypothetical protein [Solirubrobacterales bacterium]
MGAIQRNVSRSETFAGHTTLEVEICTCGVLFAAPQNLLDKRREDGRTFYCPNGHHLVYDSENERLKRDLAATRRVAQSRLDLLHAEENSHRATRGHLTRKKKQLARVSAGVCPCCNRTFQNLARHMQTKHPNERADAYRREDGAA